MVWLVELCSVVADQTWVLFLAGTALPAGLRSSTGAAAGPWPPTTGGAAGTTVVVQGGTSTLVTGDPGAVRFATVVLLAVSTQPVSLNLVSRRLSEFIWIPDMLPGNIVSVFAQSSSIISTSAPSTPRSASARSLEKFMDVSRRST